MAHLLSQPLLPPLVLLLRQVLHPLQVTLRRSEHTGTLHLLCLFTFSFSTVYDPSLLGANFSAYRAAYGYDVDSQQFKDWQASQQQQYAQYYAQQGLAGYSATVDGTSASTAAGANGAQAPAPAPAPPSEPAPPPPPPA